jgi:hypothetical protein
MYPTESESKSLLIGHKDGLKAAYFFNALDASFHEHPSFAYVIERNSSKILKFGKAE